MTSVASLLADVEAARQRTLDAVATVSTAQGGFKPAPAEWSIAECLEHLCLAEQGGVNGMWRAVEALRAGEAPPPPEHVIRGLSIEEVIKRFAPPNPQAPEIARPRLFGPVAYWAAALAGLGPVWARSRARWNRSTSRRSSIRIPCSARWTRASDSSSSARTSTCIAPRSRR
jgi:hypothetical protein